MAKKKKGKRRKVRPVTPAATEETRVNVETLSATHSRRAWIALSVMMGVYAAVFITFCAIKYVYFLYNDFDLAIFSQAAWVTSRGSLYSSILGLNYLGSHMSLLMWPIAPIYAVLPHPMTLLVIQTLVLAVGAIPVFQLARRELKSEFLGVCLGALYLLFPALGYSNLYEFHPVTLATTPLLFAIYYLRAGRLGWMTLFAVLALAAKENVALVVGMMGLYAFAVRRPRRWLYAGTLLALAGVFLVVSFGVVMPAINKGQVEYHGFYSHWGDTLGEAMKTMITHPVRAVTALFRTPGVGGEGAGVPYYARATTAKLQYYVHVLLPVIGLALLSPLTLAIALPILAQHMLSNRVSEYTIVYHYTALVTPFLIAAAVIGLRNLLAFLQRLRHRRFDDETMRADGFLRPLAWSIGIMAVVVSVLSNVLFGPVVGFKVLQTEESSQVIWPTSYDRALSACMRPMAQRIPDEGAVATDFRFMSRAADRADVHSLHHIFKGKYTYSTRDYSLPEDLVAVAVVTNDPRYTSFWRFESGRRLRELKEKNHLKVADVAGSAVLLLRDAEEDIELYRTGSFDIKDPFRVVFGYRNKEKRFYGQLLFQGSELPRRTVSPGGKLPVHTYWQRMFPDAPDDEVRQKVPLYLLQFFICKDKPGGGLKEVHGIQRHFCYTFYPVHDWPPAETVRDGYRMILPDDIPPGDYVLVLRVLYVRGRDVVAAVGRLEDGTFKEGPLMAIGDIRVTEEAPSK